MDPLIWNTIKSNLKKSDIQKMSSNVKAALSEDTWSKPFNKYQNTK